MTCQKCKKNNVNVNASTFAKSQRRSFLWNLLWIFLTGGLWLIWMLVRKRKEKIVTVKTAVCADCGHSWKVWKLFFNFIITEKGRKPLFSINNPLNYIKIKKSSPENWGEKLLRLRVFVKNISLFCTLSPIGCTIPDINKNIACFA